MIYQSHHIKPAARTQIISLLRIKPIPQLKVWENCARQFLSKGWILETCIILDILASHYGRQMGKTVAERVLGIPLNRTGRGLTAPCHHLTHPGYYALRDQISPLTVGPWVALRAGGNILLTSTQTTESHFIHAFTPNPTQAPAFPSPSDRLPIQWITFDHCIIYTNGSNTLTVLDLSDLDFNLSAEQAQEKILRTATLQFDSNIKNICGPLNDGTFFVTCEPQIPILSDVCRLCALDMDKIRQTWQQNNITCDIQSIDALKKNILLVNTEQTLNGDCCPNGDHFITCCGGMQTNEVRFIFSDGSWKTKFVHEAPLLRIIPSEAGPVSLDKDGRAFLWHNQTPIDHAIFLHFLSDLSNTLLQYIQDIDFTIDWTHKRLYLTLITPPQASLAPTLQAMHSCCIHSENINSDTFVKKIYHCNAQSFVMLADGSLHPWDLQNDCVSCQWQLSKAYADASDWNEVLSSRSPAIEQDPRIRILDLAF